MRNSVSSPAFLVALTVLQGCTVSDTLTPPLDVGTSGSISKPLTQSDMQTAMEQNQNSYQPTMPIQAHEPAYSDPSQQIASAQPSPQNSLEAQAQALQNGYNPVESAPLDSALPRLERRRQSIPNHHPADDRQAAQEQPMPTRQQEELAQADEAPAHPATTEPVASPAQSSDEQASHEQAAIAPNSAASNTIRFLPIIGAPPQVIMPLSRQLGAEAQQKGLVLRDSSGEQAQHILKGYFSAYGDGNRTVVVYVWDVLDANGNRLHRIQGQETVPGTAKDPWASVPASTMQIIATRTMDAYQEWYSKTTG